MNVVSACPLRVASVLWQPRAGAFVLTVVCKATYSLRPVESPLASEQDPPNERDGHWNDDERYSLHDASDLSPFKPRADVFLVGHAYAPEGAPVSSVVARMIVGDVDKSIEVHADRVWTQDGQLQQGARFSRMPLRYERAGGGPMTSNPVGMRPDARPDRYGRVPVPNLQPPGYHVARPGDAVPSIGLGPIAPGWPGRTAKLYGAAAGWDHRTGLQKPLPQGIDPGFFNAAPPDQQTTELRTNERIVLEHLHPEHPRLLTSLSGPSPRAMVERPGAVPQALALHADTLAIDTDRGVCSLVWRGQVVLAHAGERGRVVIAAAGEVRVRGEALDAGARPPAAAPPTSSSLPSSITMPTSVLRQMAQALPFGGAGAPEATPTAKTSEEAAPRADDAAAVPRRGDLRMRTLLPTSGPAREVLPFVKEAPVEEAPPMTMAPAMLAAPVTPWALERDEITRQIPVPQPPAPPPPEPSPPPPAIVFAPIVPIAPLPIAVLASAPLAEVALPPIAPVVPIAPLPIAEPPPPPPAELAPAPAPPSAPEAVPAPPPPEPAAPAPEPPRVERAPLSFDACAKLDARLAHRARERERILSAEDLTEEAWVEQHRRHARAVDDELARGKRRLLAAYDEAYVAALEAERGPITAAAYGRLMVAVERGQGSAMLGKMDLPEGALMRIRRVWLARTVKDTRLAAEVRASMRAAAEE